MDDLVVDNIGCYELGCAPDDDLVFENPHYWATGDNLVGNPNWVTAGLE